MHVTLRGQKIWYETSGETGTPVVLVMGFGISGRAWAPQVRTLEKHHRVVIYDNRGIGESETSHTPYGFGDLADDTVALMDHLGYETAHVAGVSMGGMISQHIAIRHPDRVKSLSLIATHPGGAVHWTVPGLKGLSLFVRANTSHGDVRIEALRHLLYTPDYRENARPEDDFEGDSMEVFAVPADQTTRMNQLKAILKHDVTRQLKTLKMPTLVVRPDQDLLVRPVNSDRIHKLVPGSKLLSFAGAGHGVTHQCAAELNQHLLTHFALADGAEA